MSRLAWCFVKCLSIVDRLCLSTSSSRSITHPVTCFCAQCENKHLDCQFIKLPERKTTNSNDCQTHTTKHARKPSLHILRLSAVFQFCKTWSFRQLELWLFEVLTWCRCCENLLHSARFWHTSVSIVEFKKCMNCPCVTAHHLFIYFTCHWELSLWWRLLRGECCFGITNRPVYGNLNGNRNAAVQFRSAFSFVFHSRNNDAFCLFHRLFL